MAHKYIVDTHTLIWFLEGNNRLSQSAKAIMVTPDSEMVLPLIVLAEAAIVIEKGRTTIPDVSRFLTRVYADPRIEIYPLTLEIFQRSLTLEGRSIPEMHDRFIVSTGLYLQDLGHTIEILTKDEIITNAGVLPIIW
jgi:PIN domain nuclease of toxin-antitoxin system